MTRDERVWLLDGPMRGLKSVPYGIDGVPPGEVVVPMLPKSPFYYPQYTRPRLTVPYKDVRYRRLDKLSNGRWVYAHRP